MQFAVGTQQLGAWHARTSRPQLGIVNARMPACATAPRGAWSLQSGSEMSTREVQHPAMDGCQGAADPVDAPAAVPCSAAFSGREWNLATQCRSAWRRGQVELARARRYGKRAGMGRMLAMGLALPVLPGSPWEDLVSNRVLMSGFWAWFLAQFGKIFTKRFKKGVWDIRAVIEPGGMPSSHSSLCMGVTTAIALQYGFASPLFAIAIAFSVIVMYDAMGVRQHAGKQAEVLNQVINELMDDHPVVGEVKLKEVLGHTPRQVACGALVGLVTGLLYPSVCPGVVA